MVVFVSRQSQTAPPQWLQQQTKESRWLAAATAAGHGLTNTTTVGSVCVRRAEGSGERGDASQAEGKVRVGHGGLLWLR
jgi:hypothetical protein